MDSNGRITPMSPELVADLSNPKKSLEALQKMMDGGKVPIPENELPRVRKMNRKARRKWVAKQRKKLRGKTS